MIYTQLNHLIVSQRTLEARRTAEHERHARSGYRPDLAPGPPGRRRIALPGGRRLRWAAAGAAASALGFVPGAQAYSTPQLYWSDAAGSINAINIDGSGSQQTLIAHGSDPQNPFLGGQDIVVDGAHIYWTNEGSIYGGVGSSSDSIGRATLDGKVVQQDFIPDPNGNPSGLAVNGTNIYWTNRLDQNMGTIAEANLDGTMVNQSLVSGLNDPVSLVLNGAHLYWASNLDSYIGVANLDGSDPNLQFNVGSFVSPSNGPSYSVGAYSPWGLALDSSRIYWGSLLGGGTLGASNLDGTGVVSNLVSDLSTGGLSQPYPDITGVAVSVPALELSPTAPAPFTTTPQGTVSAPQTLTVSNGGQQNLSIDGLSFGGADPGDFQITSNSCLGQVAPGESCQVTVSFAPQAQGSRTATLQIASNDYANSPMIVQLSGTGGPLPQGPAGAQGAAGPASGNGSSGTAGLKAASGSAGPAGAKGATGARGAVGPQVPAGSVTCNETSPARAVCSIAFAKGSSGTTSGLLTGAVYRIDRGRHTVAHGTARLKHGRLELTAWRLRPGRYELTLILHRRHQRSIVVRRPLIVRAARRR